MMHLDSIFVGLPVERDFAGKTARTAIVKSEVSGAVRVGSLCIEGDGQADLKHHGGSYKAVYSFSREHYDYWRAKPEYSEIEFGTFGENLITVGLDENTVCVGDQYTFGEVLLEVTGPRMPCNTLAMKLNDPTIIKKFLESGRPGIYFRVVKEGSLAPDAPISKVASHPDGLSLLDLFWAKQNKGNVEAIAQRTLSSSVVDPDWKRWAQQKIK